MSTQAVYLGVELLDRAYPEWWLHINVETLDLRDHRHCILGQLYGDFGNGRAVLKITRTTRYGFDSITGYDEDYEALTQKWKAVISDRKEQQWD